MPSAVHTSLRRVQLGAALGALDLVGEALDPFAELFAEELAEVIALSVDQDLDSARVETVSAGFDVASGWLEVLHDGYGLALDRSMALEAFALRWGPRSLAIALGQRREGLPSLGLGVFGQLAPVDVFRHLSASGAVGVADWDAAMGMVSRGHASAVRVQLDTPQAEPVYAIDTPVVLARPGDLRAFLAERAVSEEQQDWWERVCQRMYGRGAAPVIVRSFLGPAGLLPRVQIQHPNVPERIALQLILLFCSDPSAPQRLGAVAAALEAGERVGTVHIELGARDTPLVGIEFRAAQPGSPASLSAAR